MDYISIAIGLFAGFVIGWLSRPQQKNNADKTIRLETLAKQLQSENDGLRIKCEKLVADSAANAARVAELTSVREKMLNDFRAVSAELIEKQKEEEQKGFEYRLLIYGLPWNTGICTCGR